MVKHQLIFSGGLDAKTRAEKASMPTKWCTKWHTKWCRYMKKQFIIISSNYTEDQFQAYSKKKLKGHYGLKLSPYQILAGYYVVSQKNCIRDHWQITFVTLNRFCQLSNPQPIAVLKGCVCYIFTSLFFKSKREHLSNREKFFISL